MLVGIVNAWFGRGKKKGGGKSPGPHGGGKNRGIGKMTLRGKATEAGSVKSCSKESADRSGGREGINR